MIACQFNGTRRETLGGGGISVQTRRALWAIATEAAVTQLVHRHEPRRVDALPARAGSVLFCHVAVVVANAEVAGTWMRRTK
jgi:hypothetical protein